MYATSAPRNSFTKVLSSYTSAVGFDEDEGNGAARATARVYKPGEDPSVSPAGDSYLCTVTELASETTNLMGYVMKLVKEGSLVTMRGQGACRPVYVHSPPFHFYMDRATGKYGRRFREPRDDDDNPTRIVVTPLTPTKQLEEPMSPMRKVLGAPKEYKLEDLKYVLIQQIARYGRKVATKRLIAGNWVDIHWERAQYCQSILQGEMGGIATRRPALLDNTTIEKAKISKARKDFQKSLSVLTTPVSIRNLLVVSTMLFLSLFVLTAVEYAISEAAANRLKDSLKMQWFRSQIRANVGNGINLAVGLTLSNAGTLNTYKTAAQRADLKQRIGNVTLKLPAYMDQLMEFASQYPKIYNDLAYQKDISLRMYSDTGVVTSEDNYTYTEAEYLMGAALLNILETPVESLSLTKGELLFLRDNYANAFAVKLSTSKAYVVGTLLDYIDKQMMILLAVLIIALCLDFVASVMFFPFLSNAQWSKEEVLTYFLRLPKHAIGKLYAKCERYYMYFQKEKTQEVFGDTQSEAGSETQQLTEGSLQGEDETVQQPQPRRGRMNGSGNRWWLLAKIVAVDVIMSAYFIFAYVYMSRVGNVYRHKFYTINAVSSLSELPVSVVLYLRETVLQSDVTLSYSSDKYAVTDATIEDMRANYEEVVSVSPLTLTGRRKH